MSPGSTRIRGHFSAPPCHRSSIPQCSPTAYRRSPSSPPTLLSSSSCVIRLIRTHIALSLLIPHESRMNWMISESVGVGKSRTCSFSTSSPRMKGIGDSLLINVSTWGKRPKYVSHICNCAKTFRNAHSTFVSGPGCFLRERVRGWLTEEQLSALKHIRARRPGLILEIALESRISPARGVRVTIDNPRRILLASPTVEDPCVL
jgi:hypothetical protein